MVTKRTSVILRRWGSIIAQGLLGAAILPLVGSIFLNCSWLAKWSWAIGVGAVAGLGVLRLRSKSPLGSFLGLRYLAVYPPPWVAAVVGLTALMAFLAWEPRVAEVTKCGQFEAGALIDFLIPGLLLLVYLAGSLSFLFNQGGCGVSISRVMGEIISEQELSTEQPRADISGTLPEKLILWLRDDNPVRHPNDDRFGLRRIAERIAKRISESKDTSLTITLTGEFGSGKSSILRMVAHRLIENGCIGHDLVLVRVGLWPFETKESAIRGILQELTKALSNYINTSSIAGLADEYVSVVESAGAPWGGLLRSFGRRSPSEVLTDYDNVATAIGVRIVLWIEDLERFVRFNQNSGPSDTGVERLESIRSLLHELSKLNRLCVVLSTKSLELRLDMEKISKYVEPIPSIGHVEAWAVISEFREYCLKRAPFIDPAQKRVREYLSKQGADGFQGLSHYRSAHMDLRDAISRICNNPRKLKFALRHCLDIWDRIAGEIDFDDLLILSIVRTAEPDAFVVISEYIEHSWGVMGDTKTKRERELKEQFCDHLKKTVADEDRRAMLESVYDFIFMRDSKPQGVAASREYWERFTSMERVDDLDQDQPVLREIEAWRRDNASKGFLDILIAGKRKEFVQTCIRNWTEDEAVSLLDCVFTHALETGTLLHRQGFYSFNGPDTAWNLIGQKINEGSLETDSKRLRCVVTHLAKSSVSIHWGAAMSILYFFLEKGNHARAYRFFSDQVAVSIRRVIYDEILEFVSVADVARLCGVLKGAEPYTVKCLVLGFKSADQNTADIAMPFKTWSALRRALLGAAMSNQAVILPQIALMITRPHDTLWGGGLQFSKDNVSRLSFELEELAGVFVDISELGIEGHDERAACLEVERGLKEMLEEQRGAN